MTSSPILTGYRGGDAAYRVWLRGHNTLVEETLEDNGVWVASPLSNTQRGKIDRIAFSKPDVETPFWLLPVLWDGGGKLKVGNPGAENSKLQVHCLVRCWLESGGEAVSLTLEAKPSGTKLHLTDFEIPEIKAGNQIATPVDYSGEVLSLLHAERLQPQGIGGAFQMPTAGV